MALAVLLTLCICGTVSAEDLSSTGGNDSDAQSTVSDNQTVIDPIIGVKVGYEYSSDSSINPEITVKDNNGTKIAYNKTYDMAFQGYKLSFLYPGAVNGTKFNVTVAASGYTTQTKEVGVFFDPNNSSDPNLYGSSTFNMMATANYKLGREVTKKADQLLNFSSADSVLCITTAGAPYRNGTTTEDCLEGILNGANGLISYGQGNLLMLRETKTDPVDFGFIVKNGSNLTLAYFKNGTLTPNYVGTLSEDMTLAQWKIVKEKLGSDAYPYASLANAWDIGLSSDILREAAFHGHVCLGTISGYAMIETLLKYYPPGQLTADKEATSYLVVGTPGESEDDAFIIGMDNTPGKRAYVGFNTTDSAKITGFIRWNSKTKKGTLVIMTFDEDAVVKEFKNETGLDAYSSISNELKFNKWLVYRLQNNPESLVSILYAFDNLTEEQVNYINGGTGSTTEGDAHGLDLNYILNQTNLVTATANNLIFTKGNLTSQEMKDIGLNASNKAKELFLSEMGINLEMDDFDFLVLTSAGYARLNGQATDMMWDGIYSVFGSRVSRTTLLPVHSSMWSNLWFTFILRKDGEGIAGLDGSFGKFSFTIDEDDSFLYAIYMYYDPVTNQLVVANDSSGKTIHDIGPACNQTLASKLFGSWNSIDTIANAWAYDPPYDMLMAYLFHNHVCPGVSPSYLITDYIFENYPLGENEKYIYVTTNDYCDDDGIMYLLGVSPGAGTYYNQRLKNNTATTGTGNREGYLIVWDDKTQTGKVIILTYKGPKFANGSNALKEYINLYRKQSSGNVVSQAILGCEAERVITKADLSTILSGAPEYGNAINFILGLPANRTLADILPKKDGSNGTNTNNGNHLVDNGGSSSSDSSNHDGSSSSSGSSVGTSVPVSAAMQTTTESVNTGSSPQKAYEMSKAGSTKGESNSNWYVYVIVGFLSLGGLVGFGFMRAKT